MAYCYKQDLYKYMIEVLETEPDSPMQQAAIEMCQKEIARLQKYSQKQQVIKKKVKFD